MHTISLPTRLTRLIVAAVLGLVACGISASQAGASTGRLASWNQVQHPQIGQTYSSFNVPVSWQVNRYGLASVTGTAGSAFAWNRLGGCVQVSFWGHYGSGPWRFARTFTRCVPAGYAAQLRMTGVGISGYGLRGVWMRVCYSRYASTGVLACSADTSWR